MTEILTAKQVGIVHWPYGANNDDKENVRKRLLEWATARKVRYSQRGRCLHWISKGQCNVRFCIDGHGSHRWMDHITGWTRDSKPAILLCQPYWLHTGTMIDLVARAESFNLEINIHGDGWYGYGTVCIELSPKKQHDD